MNSRIFRAFCFIFSLAVLTFSAVAFPGEADTSYNPFISRSRRSGAFDIRLMRYAQQPDGKTIIVGNFSAFDGFAATGVVRLDTDGNVDPTFNPPEIYNYEYLPSNRKKETLISTVAVQADGKIIIGGDFTKVNGVYRPSVARLNADGTPDTTFNAALGVGFTGSIYDVGVQPSGKILVGGNFCYSHPNLSRCGLVRLNPDGTPDTTFADVQGACRFRVAPDGKIGYLSNFQSFMKLEVDGTLDSSFAPQSIAVTNLTELFDVLFENDGSVLVGGTFEFVNGIFRRFIVKFLPNGTVDPNFGGTLQGEIQGRVTSFLKLPDGKILMAGSFSRCLLRMTTDGQIDTTFFYQRNDGQINFTAPLPNNRFIAGGQIFPRTGATYNRLERIEVNGAVDNSYTVIPAAQPLVTAVAKQADGKIIVGGRFSDANGVLAKNIVRYNVDGSRDITFGPSLPSVSDAFQINDIKVLADGKIMIAPGSQLGLTRLNPNGSLDTTFVSQYPQTQNYTDLAPLSDGSLIIVGGVGLKKISPNVSTFNLNNSFRQQSGAAGILNKVVVQTDEKIIVVGEFTTVNSVPRSRIARFNADGTLDTTFDTSVGANATITSVKIQADGKILVGGTFTNLGGNTSVQGIGRLNTDGSVDSSFVQTANYSVHSIETQTDGKIVIGGEFTQVGNVPRSGLARLNANGSLDTSFQVGSGTNGAVFELALQDDGKVVIGGDFTKYNNITKIGVARVLNNAAQPVRTNFDFDGDSKADLGVFRPSNSIWYQLLGSNYNFNWTQYGLTGDVLTPADYDGDGKTDISIFRPSTGQWVYGNQQFVTNWGQNGDIPLPSDVDGDGKADFVVFRPSDRHWYRLTSGSGVYSFMPFGAVGDQPIIGDFDGDGKSDPAVFRPSSGEWFYAASSQNGIHLRAALWGLAGDKLVPADYDGDGKTDAAIFRNGLWAIRNSSNNSNTILTFGQAGDKPVAADYDGDGKADIAVYRPDDGTWYILRSTNGFQALTFGASTDIPIQNAFVQ